MKIVIDTKKAIFSVWFGATLMALVFCIIFLIVPEGQPLMEQIGYWIEQAMKWVLVTTVCIVPLVLLALLAIVSVSYIAYSMKHLDKID